MSKPVVLAAAILCVAGYALVYATGRANPPIRSDGYSYYVYLPSWFIYGDTSLSAVARDCCGGEFPAFTAIIRWPGTRRWVNAHPIGVAVMQSPFFLLGHGLTKWSNLSPDGFTVYYQHAAGLAGLFWTIAGLYVLRRLLLRHFSDSVTAATLVALLFGTGLYHYATYDSSYSHAYSFFLFAAFLDLTETWHSPSLPSAATAQQVPLPSAATAQQVPLPSAATAQQVPLPSAATAQQVPLPSAATAQQVPLPSAATAQQVPLPSAATAQQVPLPSAATAQQVPLPSAATAQQVPLPSAATAQQVPLPSAATAQQAPGLTSAATAQQVPVWSRTVLLGIVAGLIVLTRHTNVLFLLVLPLYGVTNLGSLRDARRRLSARWRELAVIAGVAAFVVLPQLAIYYRATGRVLVSSYGDLSFNFLSPHIWGVLFSVQKGLFFWSPLLLAAAAGFALGYKRARPFVVGAVVVMLLDTYLIASWWDWQFGASYGHRGFIDTLPLFAIGLAALFEWSAARATRKGVVAIAAAAVICLSMFQMLQYWNGVMPMSDVTWDQYRAVFLRFR